VLERLKAVPAVAGQKPPILVYLGVLLQKGKLNALESAELARWGAEGICATGCLATPPRGGGVAVCGVCPAVS
jgi:hypothetical protein